MNEIHIAVAYNVLNRKLTSVWWDLVSFSGVGFNGYGDSLFKLVNFKISLGHKLECSLVCFGFYFW